VVTEFANTIDELAPRIDEPSPATWLLVIPANVNVVAVVDWVGEVPRVGGIGVPCADELGWPQLAVDA
jgi:hypothetical protein